MAPAWWPQTQFQGDNYHIWFSLIQADNDEYIQSAPDEQLHYANQKEKQTHGVFALWSKQKL